MPEPTKLNVKVTTESHGRKTKIGRLLTLEALILLIRKLKMDDYTTNGLIALASKYPAAALPSFKKNINLMISRVQSQRQKDQEGESYAKPKEKPKIHPSLDKNQVFDTGPKKISITEEDLRDEWESEDKECILENIGEIIPIKKIDQ